jgi:type IV secretory pathway TraG/TraD family ATPase VirD4
MKKLARYGVVLTGLVVMANAKIRPEPSLHPERIEPWFHGHELLTAALTFFLTPGLWVFWYLGFTPSTGWELWAMGFLSLWAWTTLLRLFYCIVGRWFGFYNPNHFRYFLWVPWRPLWKVARVPLRWREEVKNFGTQASGGWMSFPDRLCLVHRSGDIFLGLHRACGMTLQQPAGINGERHVAIIAGAGSGKTSHAITWLTMHEGSAYIIDPKGVMARATAARMGRGAKGVFGKGATVRVLDPFGTSGLTSAWFNPFAQMERFVKRNGPASAVRYAMKIADGLIVRYGQENPFWPGSAKAFLVGLILYVFKYEPPERRTLTRLFELLCNGLAEKTQPGKNPFGALLRTMSECPDYGGVIAASANALADAGETTYGNVLITMREQLKWLNLPEVRTICEPSIFRDEVDLEQLVTARLILYVCAPVTDIRGPLAGWFRLLSVLGLYAFEDFQRRLTNPCLFVLDEFPSLGKIDSVEIAAPVMRSMGVRLCVIAQDIAQLRDVYPNTWEGFLGSAEAVLLMATNHQETLLYFERAVGTKLVKRKLDGGWLSQVPARFESRNEPVIYAEQLKRLLGRGVILVMLPGNRPFTTARASYFDYAPVYFFEPDRDHRERLLRRPTRRAFEALVPVKAAKPFIAPHEPKLLTAADQTQASREGD